MLQRFTHAAVAFAITAALYQAYVVAITPFVERSVALESAPWQKERSDDDPSTLRFRNCLAAYFPEGHWCLGKPITLDNGQLVALLDARYQETNDGKVRVNRCVLIYFPNPRSKGGPAQREAVVVDAPEGAVLQLDSTAGVAGGGWDEIQHGQLVGPIVMRSDMRDAGPEDDLLLVARDLWVNKDFIRTTEAVELKMGRHAARGRKLEIRLLSEHRSSDISTPLQGLESLEITHDVFVEISPETAPSAATEVLPPIRIQSDGPFSFDFANYKATFADGVRVRQLHADGALDELQAKELNLFFDPTVRSASFGQDGPARSAAIGDDGESEALSESSMHALAKLQPASIEALGAPAVLMLPSRKAAARGSRLWLEISQRRITVEGGDEVRLVFDGSEVHAPLVQYQHPPASSSERVGTLLAAGRGWLRREGGDGTGGGPAGDLEVVWQQQIRIDRRDGQPVLSLWGRPVIALAGVGKIWADRLELAMHETPPRRSDSAETDASHMDNWPVFPDRLAASGSVAIDAPELSARVDRLGVQFTQASGDADSPDETEGPSFGKRTSGRLAVGRRYAVSGNRLDMVTTVQGKAIAPREITVEGNAVFAEESSNAAPGEALRVVAEQLRVTEADSPNAQIEIHGSIPSPASLASTAPGKRLAEISTAGASLRAESLVIKRAASEASIDAPGEVQLTMARDLAGNLLERPEPLTIRWSDAMHLRGRRIEFRGDVVAQHPSGYLQTPRLVAQMSADVRFDASPQQHRPELEQIECWEGVVAEIEQSDTVGPTARHRIQLESIVVNQSSGDISGKGPGNIESAHLSNQANFWNVGQGPGANDAAPVQRLKFLGVEFMQAVRGNLHRRQLELSGDTRAVYGPIDAWEERLRLTPDDIKSPHTYWISSDVLQVVESPAAAISPKRSARRDLGPLELAARGRVIIEGEDPRRGAFTARAKRASYDQAKEVFVLEGDSAAPATIARQEVPGAQPSQDVSYEILSYSLRTGEVKAKGVKAEWNQIDLRSRNAP